MNKKAIIAIIAVVVIVIGGGAAFAITRNAPENVSTTSAVSETESTSTTGTSEAASTTTSATVSSTTQADANQYKYVTSGTWYYFDDDARQAYAFQFEANDDDVNITYFDSSNVDGEDAKFFTGDADYKIIGDEIIIDDVPSAVGVSSFKFKLTETAIAEEGGNELDNQSGSKASLDYVFNHFN